MKEKCVNMGYRLIRNARTANGKRIRLFVAIVRVVEKKRVPLVFQGRPAIGVVERE